MLEEKLYTIQEWKDNILPLVRSNIIVRTDECRRGIQCGRCNGYVSGVHTIAHKFYKYKDVDYGVHIYRNQEGSPHQQISVYEKKMKLRVGEWSAKDWNNIVLPAIKKRLIKQVKTLPKGLFSLYHGILEEQDQRFEVDALIDENQIPYVKVSIEQYN